MHASLALEPMQRRFCAPRYDARARPQRPAASGLNFGPRWAKAFRQYALVSLASRLSAAISSGVRTEPQNGEGRRVGAASRLPSMICVGVDGRVPGQPNPAPATISGLLVLSQRSTVG